MAMVDQEEWRDYPGYMLTMQFLANMSMSAPFMLQATTFIQEYATVAIAPPFVATFRSCQI